MAQVERLPHPDAATAGLWRARDFAHAATGRRTATERRAGGIGTGFAELDAVLFHRGWPQAGLIEVLSDTRGIGELRLLMPALATLTAAENRWIAWIDPPFVPYAPALEAAGLDLARVLLLRPGGEREAVWAVEQALKTGACSAALGWLPESSLGFSALRRLSIAARQGCAWATLFRPSNAALAASGAELRLRLSPQAGGLLHVEIVKRRGGWPLAGMDVNVAAPDAER